MAQEREKGNEVYPPPQFWRALLHFKNHFHPQAFEDYLRIPIDERLAVETGHVFESLQIVHDWLGVAIEEGWLDD